MLLFGIRALRDLIQERVCFSHDVQGGLRGGELLLTGRELLLQPGDFGLLLAQLPATLRAVGGVFPSRIPASRSLRHSTICDEYRALARR